ncbi:MAG: hypothetical protein ACK47B_00850 [Armatimonadota bacterium]
MGSLDQKPGLDEAVNGSAPGATDGPGRGGLKLLLQLPALLWLTLVLAAYALVALRPPQHPDPYAPAAERQAYAFAPVPGLAELDAWVVPALALLGIAALAWHFVVGPVRSAPPAIADRDGT